LTEEERKMAKKDSGVNGKKPRKQRTKGNFSIFLKAQGDDADAHAGTALWQETVSGLDSTTACEKHVKENVEEFQDKTLMFAQVKKVCEIKVETKIKVSF